MEKKTSDEEKLSVIYGPVTPQDDDCSSSSSSSSSSSDSNNRDDIGFADESERLEDDQELRLHILGSRSIFSKWKTYCNLLPIIVNDSKCITVTV